jgi:hypothetical protein
VRKFGGRFQSRFSTHDTITTRSMHRDCFQGPVGEYCSAKMLASQLVDVFSLPLARHSIILSTQCYIPAQSPDLGVRKNAVGKIAEVREDFVPLGDLHKLRVWAPGRATSVCSLTSLCSTLACLSNVIYPTVYRTCPPAHVNLACPS